MTVLVVQHEPDVHLGLLGPRLSAARILRMWEDPAAIRRVLDDAESGASPLPEGIVILGGRANAYADADWPWLADTRELIRRAIDQDRRLLGICLGAQLLAVATGGSVTIGAEAGPEYGVHELHWDAAPPSSPLIAELSGARCAFEDHGDAIADLPAGRVLARSTKYPQVLAVGSALGVQFHPEVDESLVRAWQESNSSTDTEEIVAGFRAHETELARTCALLATWIDEGEPSL